MCTLSCVVDDKYIGAKSKYIPRENIGDQKLNLETRFV